MREPTSFLAEEEVEERRRTLRGRVTAAEAMDEDEEEVNFEGEIKGEEEAPGTYTVNRGVGWRTTDIKCGQWG